MKCLILAVSSLLAAHGIAAFSASGADNDFFPFTIPGDDASANAADFSRLSPRPAGAGGPVRIKDGHFYTDQGRLKIWGFNTCFGANFPAHADAEKVAAHLAKLGVNGIRIHHHETSPTPRGILGAVKDGRRTLDAAQIELLDYFLFQLNLHGIYINLNLHVGRTFTEQEGFATRELPYETRYSKYLIYFEPKMRLLFKEFCREYLGHTNPYRKLRRADDPAIAMIEITNENSFSKIGSELAARLPEPYRSEFKRQWNQWLKKEYSSTAALQRAWGSGSEPMGASVLPPANWSSSLAPWRLHQAQQAPLEALVDQPGPQSGVPAIKINILNVAAETAQQELLLPDLAVAAGKLHTLSFWIKGDAPRTLHADISRQGPANWNSIGFRENLQVTTQWQRITRVFRAEADTPAKVRLCFKFGGDATGFSLAGIALNQGGDLTILPAGQSLENGNIEIPITGWTDAARDAVRKFMADTERDFIRDITNFLKKELGIKAPITASQIDYHGASIVADTCDYVDIHAYWQHPRFPGKPWDSRNWFISNTPMEAALEADRLLSRTPWRILDRPFTISEWNIPAPNDYSASVVPYAALVAALQDWDGVFFFQYNSEADNWYTDGVSSYFSFKGHPAKLALMGPSANLYLRGDLTPLPKSMAGTVTQLLPPTLGLSYRIGIDPKAAKAADEKAPQTKRLSSPDGRVVWDASDPARAYVRVNTPQTRALWGLVGSRSFDLGGVQLAVGAVQRNYSAIMLTSLDGRAVESSAKLLLAIVGTAENKNMGWNENRTSVGNQWGKGPALANGIPAEVVLPCRASKVYALDGKGNRAAQVPANSSPGILKFKIGPEHRTLWYEIAED